jgi:hypothetical protein
MYGRLLSARRGTRSAGRVAAPGVTRMVGQVGAMISFEEGHELLRELAGVDVATKHVERAAEAVGREIALDERRVIEPPPPDEPVAPTLYLGLDGTGVPMRTSELERRPGKQPDGSSKTREVKLCTVWSAEGRDEEGTPGRDAGSVTYSAAIESAASKDTDDDPSAFAARTLREATRRGFDRAQRRAVLGDGAPWIWNLATEHFPDALQIVDRFHAKQHLSDVAKAIWAAASEAGKTWAKARHDELDAGDVEAVLGALSGHAAQVDEARQCVDYVTTNRARMRYADFHAAGLCTSTGVVEAGCKTAIGTRLHEHVRLDDGLVPGTSRPGRHDGGAVVLSEFEIGAIDDGLVAAGLGDAALEIVGNKHRGRAAPVLHHPHMGGDPGGQVLRRTGFGVYVAARTQRANEQLDGDQLARRDVHDDGPLAREVHEGFLAGPVDLAHGGGQRAGPVMVVLTELAVAIAVGMLLQVFEVEPL